MARARHYVMCPSLCVFVLLATPTIENQCSLQNDWLKLFHRVSCTEVVWNSAHFEPRIEETIRCSNWLCRPALSLLEKVEQGSAKRWVHASNDSWRPFSMPAMEPALRIQWTPMDPKTLYDSYRAARGLWKSGCFWAISQAVSSLLKSVSAISRLGGLALAPEEKSHQPVIMVTWNGRNKSLLSSSSELGELPEKWPIASMTEIPTIYSHTGDSFWHGVSHLIQVYPCYLPWSPHYTYITYIIYHFCWWNPHRPHFCIKQLLVISCTRHTSTSGSLFNNSKTRGTSRCPAFESWESSQRHFLVVPKSSKIPRFIIIFPIKWP